MISNSNACLQNCKLLDQGLSSPTSNPVTGRYSKTALDIGKAIRPLIDSTESAQWMSYSYRVEKLQMLQFVTASTRAVSLWTAPKTSPICSWTKQWNWTKRGYIIYGKAVDDRVRNSTGVSLLRLSKTQESEIGSWEGWSHLRQSIRRSLKVFVVANTFWQLLTIPRMSLYCTQRDSTVRIRIEHPLQ